MLNIHDIKAGMVAGTYTYGPLASMTRAAQRRVAKEYGFTEKDIRMTHVAPIIHDRGTILEMRSDGPAFNNLQAYSPVTLKGYRLFRHINMTEEKAQEFAQAAFELSGIQNLNRAKKYDYTLLVSQWFISHGIKYEVNAKHRDICTEFYFNIMAAIGLPLPTECVYPAILGVLARNNILIEVKE